MDRAPLLSSSRQLVVEEPNGDGCAWVRVDGKWYPTQARTKEDQMLAALAILMPCVGVALKYGFKTKKFLWTLFLTMFFYFPGLFFALFSILIEPRQPSQQQIDEAPFGFVFGTDVPAGNVLDYSTAE